MNADGLSAGAVARRLGVAVTTLRTWHQRYGLGPSRHVVGRHRRYTEEDVARLQVMQRLIAQGVTPAEAASWARRSAEARPADTAAADVRTVDALPASAPRGLLTAAMRLDVAAVRESTADAVARHGVVATWDGMLLPALVSIGERHAATGGYVEVEHLLSRTVSEVLGAVPRPSGPATVILACADEEQHSLPLEALAAALAEAGVSCRLLGARVPGEALLEAVRRTGPDAVVIWAHTRKTGDPAQLDALLAAPRPPLLLAAAGPGWPDDRLPDGVVRPATLAEALALTAPAGPPHGGRPPGHR